MRSGACHADNFNRLHLPQFIFCKKVNQCSCYNIVYPGHFIVILCISSQADKDNDKDNDNDDDNDNCFSSGLSCFSRVDKVCKLLTWLLMQQPSPAWNLRLVQQNILTSSQIFQLEATWNLNRRILIQLNWYFKYWHKIAYKLDDPTNGNFQL